MRFSHIRVLVIFFFFSSRRRHTRFDCDWSSDVCSSDLEYILYAAGDVANFAKDYPVPPAGVMENNLSTVVRFIVGQRSEERRGGEEGRSRGAPDHLKKKKRKNEKT